MPVETMQFGPIDVSFDERVLRPRAWTMLQASWAADLAPEVPPGSILELCSGAGHIGQAAAVLTGRGLVQVDVDPHACALAEGNARANVGTGQVQVRCGNLDAALTPDERFPLVLADPPYLPRDEVEAWPEDPDHAIDGGPDGLELLRRCLVVAGAHVGAEGAVLLQTLGQAQIDGLAEELDAAGLHVVEVRTAGERRAVALLRPSAVSPGRHDPTGSERRRTASRGRLQDVTV